MIWIKLNEKAVLDNLGLIATFLNLSDPRPAKVQLDENYNHGGGWRPIDGFTLDEKTGVLQYPEDPPLHPLFLGPFRDESVYVYLYGIVCVVQKDGSFEVSRMD